MRTPKQVVAAARRDAEIEEALAAMQAEPEHLSLWLAAAALSAPRTSATLPHPYHRSRRPVRARRPRRYLHRPA